LTVDYPIVPESQAAPHHPSRDTLSTEKGQISQNSDSGLGEQRELFPIAGIEVRFHRNLSHFKNLYSLMKKFLQNQPVEISDMNLSSVESQLFACFLLKKYRFNSSVVASLTHNGQPQVTPDTLPELCNWINQLSSSKRKEENVKLIFNWIFAFIVQDIQQEHKLDKELAEEYLCETYFREASQKHQIDIRKFYKPNFSRSSTDQLKTYNSTFIKNVKLSPKFMRDFAGYLQHSFSESFVGIIEEKAYIQCKKWEQQLKADCFSPRSVAKLCDLIVKNKRVKLSWSLVEAENARDVVLQNINNL